MERTNHHLLFFNLGWVAGVIFLAVGMPLAALTCISLVIASHLAHVAVPAKEAAFLAVVLAVGGGLALGMSSLGMIRAEGGAGSVAVNSMWLTGMWAVFATTINYRLSWVKNSWWISTVAGVAVGSLSLVAGSALGIFTASAEALLTLCIAWSLFMPVLSLVADTIIDSPVFEPGAPAQADSNISLTRLRFEYSQQ